MNINPKSNGHSGDTQINGHNGKLDEHHTNGNAGHQPNGNTQSNGHNGKLNEGHHTNGNAGQHAHGTTLEPIAICGMAMRLPGGIRDEKGFWDVLVNGKDTRTLIPEDRWNAEAFGPKIGKRGAIKTQYGHFLIDDLSHLDASFFSMTKSELGKTDPQQRLMGEALPNFRVGI